MQFIEFNETLVNVNKIEMIYTEKSSSAHKDKQNIFAVLLDNGDGTLVEEFATLEERVARCKELREILGVK